MLLALSVLQKCRPSKTNIPKNSACNISHTIYITYVHQETNLKNIFSEIELFTDDDQLLVTPLSKEIKQIHLNFE